MSKQFLVSITNAANDVDRATVGFVVANAALASGQEAVVFLSVEGARLAVQGFADDLHEEGFAPLKELIASFVDNGGQIWVCNPCYKKRGYEEGQLIQGATLIGGAKVVELLVNGAPSITY